MANLAGPTTLQSILARGVGLGNRPVVGAISMLGKGSQVANGLVTPGLLGVKAPPPMVVRPPQWLDAAGGKGQLGPAGTLPALSSGNWGAAAPSQGVLEQGSAMSFPTSNTALPGGILAPSSVGTLDPT